MLDLSGPDVFPEKRNMAGKWSRQPYVREGFLTLLDAACLMAAEGYGGIYGLCSRYTKNEIDGIAEALKMSLDGAGALEGYSPVNRLVEGKKQDVYPLIAFKHWAERTGCGDGRYFAKAAAPGGSAPTGSVPSAGEAPKKSPLLYVGRRKGRGDGRYFAKAAAPGGSAPTGGVPSAGEVPKKSPFRYEGSFEVNKNTPRYALLIRKESMTVYDFACLYCGIDPGKRLPTDVYKSYVEPLIDFLGEHMVLEDDVPF